jgi:hypothetical protein
LPALFSSLDDLDAALRVRLRPRAFAVAAVFFAAALGFFFLPAMVAASPLSCGSVEREVHCGDAAVLVPAPSTNVNLVVS